MFRAIQVLACLTVVEFLIVSSSVEEEWKSFKVNFYKTYSSVEDEQKHFSSFKDNFKEIERHNKLYQQGEAYYKKGITKFADLTDDEFTENLGLFTMPLFPYEDDLGKSRKNTNSSEFLDWREQGAVTHVKDQGTCGSCWIFSAVGMLEGYYYRKTKKLVSFSEQQMVDCISNSTCSGGWFLDVFDYLSEIGKKINTEEDYPYKGVSEECRFEKSSASTVDFRTYIFAGGSEDRIKKALATHGPLIVTLYANNHWKLYSSGVWYESQCANVPNHAVLLVGYGRENGHDYWIVKNSFGKNWGENGYIKFIRNKHENYCGLSDTAFYLL